MNEGSGEWHGKREDGEYEEIEDNVDIPGAIESAHAFEVKVPLFPFSARRLFAMPRHRVHRCCEDDVGAIEVIPRSGSINSMDVGVGKAKENAGASVR